jgi:hypothetical protein
MTSELRPSGTAVRGGGLGVRIVIEIRQLP